MTQTNEPDPQLHHRSKAMTNAAIENIFTPQEFITTLTDLDEHAREAEAALKEATRVSSRTLLLISRKLFKMTNGEAMLIFPLIAQWQTGLSSPSTPLLNAINLSGENFIAAIPRDAPPTLVLIPTGQIGWANLTGGGRVVNFQSLDENHMFDPAQAIRIFTNLKTGLGYSIKASKAAAQGLNDFTDALRPLLQLLDVEHLLQTGKKAGIS